MCPRRIVQPAPPRVRAAVARIAQALGQEVRDERLRRGWRLIDLAERADVSMSTARGVEAGEVSSLDGYVRLALALGLTPRFTLLPERASRPVRDADPVHAAMGEVEAAHLRGLGYEVRLDEPYQHYQFAGRADLVAIDRKQRALLHLENRTRFPDVQAFVGAYNAKRAYLGPDLARRLGVTGGFRSETHVVMTLWSAEALHTMRLREESFRSVCPDSPDSFVAWWAGSPPSAGPPTSSQVTFDPLPGQPSTRRRWVGLEQLRQVEPRYRGYADALTALRRDGVA